MSKFEEAAQAAEEVLDILAKAFATGNIRFSFARRPDGEVVAVLGTTYGAKPFCRSRRLATPITTSSSRLRRRNEQIPIIMAFLYGLNVLLTPTVGKSQDISLRSPAFAKERMKEAEARRERRRNKRIKHR